MRKAKLLVNLLAFLAAIASVSAAAQNAVLTKAFSPTTIAAGGSTVLTFTVTNPAGSPALSNVSFVDTLPSTLTVAATPGVGGTCANAAAATTATGNSGTITVANLQVPAGASSCTVTVNVGNVSGQSGTCPDVNLTNAAGNIGNVQNVANSVVPTCLTVVAQSAAQAAIPTLNEYGLLLLLMLVAIAGAWHIRRAIA